MTIAVVQSKAFSGASSGSFTADITATSAVMLWIFQYTTSGAAMSSSAPTFNGSASGFTPVKIMEAQSPGTNAVYGACWMLPDLAGGAASIGITASGGVVDGNVGMVAIEVSGLGAAPQLDAGATPNPEVTALASGTVASGPTGAITASPELILGMAVIFGATFAAPGSPWTSLGTGSGLDSAGWQVVTSPGGTYGYSPGGGTANSFLAGVAAVRGTSAAAAGPVPYLSQSSGMF